MRPARVRLARTSRTLHFAQRDDSGVGQRDPNTRMKGPTALFQSLSGRGGSGGGGTREPDEGAGAGAAIYLEKRFFHSLMSDDSDDDSGRATDISLHDLTNSPKPAASRYAQRLCCACDFLLDYFRRRSSRADTVLYFPGRQRFNRPTCCRGAAYARVLPVARGPLFFCYRMSGASRAHLAPPQLLPLSLFLL